jgi:hypothetical protein
MNTALGTLLLSTLLSLPCAALADISQIIDGKWVVDPNVGCDGIHPNAECLKPFLPPAPIEAADGGSATGNNCYLEVRFLGQGTNEIGYQIERQAEGSPDWRLVAVVPYYATNPRIEIAGTKRGLIRMRSFGSHGSWEIDYSVYSSPVLSFCQEN